MTRSEPSYEALTETTAIALAKTLELFSADADLICHEIGDGNLNMVFRITEPAAKRGIIIKQALPYVRVIGEGWPLTLNRAVIESEALRHFAKHVPQYVPEIYYTDPTYAITVMEDLSHLTIVRTGLASGSTYPLLSTHIGEFLAKTLFATSDFAMGPQEKRELALQFHNPELCKITENFVFTYPLFDHETNDVEPILRPIAEQIWGDQFLLLEAAKLKQTFITHAEVLLHGDLHTGSIFASDEETKVIDPEFAFYGPIGFDIGLFIANTLLSALAREEDGRDALLFHITNVWDVFVDTFSTLWQQNNVEDFASIEGYLDYQLQHIFEDAVGFAGSEIIRRIFGLAHARDIEAITEDDHRLSVKRNAAALGRDFIVNRSLYQSPAQLVHALQQVVTGSSIVHPSL